MSLGVGAFEKRELSRELIYDILSLQENGLYIGEDGEWRMLQKKKRGGKIDMEKLQTRFEKHTQRL